MFTGAVYDILADMLLAARTPAVRDDAVTLHECAAYLRSLVLRALLAAPDTNPQFADVAWGMLTSATEDRAHPSYSTIIRDR